MMKSKKFSILLAAISLISIIPAFSLDFVSIKQKDGTTITKDIINGSLTIDKSDMAVEILKGSFDSITSLKIDRTGYLNDFSFLKEMQNLERLVLFATNISDFTFLKEMANLQVFWIEGADFSVGNKEIDFSGNPLLETISISNSSMHNPAILINMPKGLKNLVLWFNKIEDVSSISKKGLPKTKIFLIDNKANKLKTDKRFIIDSKEIPRELHTVLP